MSKKWRIDLVLAAVIVVVAAVIGVRAFRVQLWEYGFDREVGDAEKQLRLAFVETAEAWLGAAEGSPEHEEILAVYNGFEPLAQGYTVKSDDNWCATFVSTVAIQCGLTDIIPTECGCQRQIGLFQDLGRWEEDDGCTPLPGDIIYYCSSDRNPLSDCTGWSDHVGIVVGTCNGYIKVIEGNNGNSVRYRYIQVNGTGIRGFGVPDFAAKCA